MTESPQSQDNLDSRLKKSNKSIFIWTTAWLLTTASLAFGPKLIWDFNMLISGFAVLLNIAFGIKMLLANKSLFDGMDELQRKIHFNAMAVSLGVTMILGCLYGLLEPAGILEETPPPSNILFVMGISYLIAVFVNFRKYL